MNVLVTGATGFVGTALLERLGREKCSVRAAVMAGESTQDLPSDVDAVVVEPLSAKTDHRGALRGIDVVMHLAARVHVMRDAAPDPLAAFREVNVDGTSQLARQAAANGVRRLVFLSSVKVNGEGRPTPYSEDDAPAPEDPYGLSKWEAELELRRVAAETGLEVVIVRSPLVYGPGVKANFRRLLEAVLRGVPLPLGSVGNRRSLIGLRNLVDALVLCATHPQAGGNTYLVSDDSDVSTPDLVRLIAAAVGRPVRIVPFPLPLMRLIGRMTGKGAAIERLIGSLTVDSRKIRRELNWKPPYTLQQGLADTVEWMVRQTRAPGFGSS